MSIQKKPNSKDTMHDQLCGEINAGDAYPLNSRRANKQVYKVKHHKPQLQKPHNMYTDTLCIKHKKNDVVSFGKKALSQFPQIFTTIYTEPKPEHKINVKLKMY